MALERGKLSNVCIVAAGTSVGIVTVASSKKVYVKSILAHAGTAITATAQVYMCPTGFGTAISGAKIYDVNLLAGETVEFAPSYPIVLSTTNDALWVGAGGGGGGQAGSVNFVVTGDREA